MNLGYMTLEMFSHKIWHKIIQSMLTSAGVNTC